MAAEEADDGVGEDVSMINVQMYIDSIRTGGGYNNTAMALAELIDNSLQAGATDVDVLVAEANIRSGRSRIWQIQEIAVLDNGKGMDTSLLQRSLRFGDGENHKDGQGMGKFGVGLPQASVSQAPRIDVWSWQNGVDSAKHAYIDLDDKEWTKKFKILWPDDEELPTKWIDNSRIRGDTGTLVVWSNLDNISWKRAETIFNNSEEIVGRMYRNWMTTDNSLGKQKAIIQLLSFDNSGKEEREGWMFKPTDPMYLLSRSNGMKSSTKRSVKFSKWGDGVELKYVIPVKMKDEMGESYIAEVEEKVNLKFSLAPKELREPYEGTDAGNLDYGKHARKNTGVSIMRSGRELKLETKFVTSKDPRNRWWGAEIQFGPGMDDILGVANNKQDAKRLQDNASKDWEDMEMKGKNETPLQIKKRLKEEELATFICLDISTKVRNNISKMLTTIQKTPTSSKSGRNRHADSPERKGTEATKVRMEEGYQGDSDLDEENMSKEDRIEKIKEFLAQIDADNSDEVLGDLIDAGLKYSFRHAYQSDVDAFFSVDGIAGKLIITLNRSHAAYNELFETLQMDTDGKTPQELNQMLLKAQASLMTMLIAWSRNEDEASGGAKIRLKDARNDWGRMTRDFLLFGKE